MAFTASVADEIKHIDDAVGDIEHRETDRLQAWMQQQHDKVNQEKKDP